LSHTVPALCIKSPRLASSKAGICGPFFPSSFILRAFALARPTADQLSQPSRHLPFWSCAPFCHFSRRSRSPQTTALRLATDLCLTPHYRYQRYASLPTSANTSSPTTTLRPATDDCYTSCYRRPFNAIANRSSSGLGPLLRVLVLPGSRPLLLKNYFDLTSLDLPPTLQNDFCPAAAAECRACMDVEGPAYGYYYWSEEARGGVSRCKMKHI